VKGEVRIGVGDRVGSGFGFGWVAIGDAFRGESLGG
jgi:hypothetical protein